MAEVATQTLPQVMLRNLHVPLQVLSLIPFETVEKYQVSAFEVGDTELKLAVVYPEQLKQGFYTALTDIGKRIGRNITLYRTDAGSMRAITALYKSLKEQPEVTQQAIVEPVPVLPTVATPMAPLFELGRTVAFNYLKRIPLEYSQENRLLCVDFLAPNTYWFISDTVDNEKTRQLLQALIEVNKITGHLLPVKKGELDDLLKYYERLLLEPPVTLEQEQEQEQQKELSVSDAMPLPKQITLAPGVVVPDIQATILSQEDEKAGVAGLFQRVSHTFGPKNVDIVHESGQATQIEAVTLPTPSIISTPPAELVPATTPAKVVPVASEIVVKEEKRIVAKTVEAKIDDSADIGKLLTKSVDTLDELKGHVKSGSIPRIVAATVNFAIHEKASDIHIEAFEDEIRVRYRIDGQLNDVIKLPPDIHAAMVSRIKILTKLRLDETRVPQDGRFNVGFDNAQVDLRVSILPTVHGEKVVMRILDRNRGATSLESLGIMGLAYQNVLKSIQKPFGICLATGPTGSGKSTSLYAILGQIATPNVNVSTLEDPVEFEMKGVNQSQIRPKIGFTFAEGLRSLLRQDPNIIMVGEIRDGETANMATQAALTGHLVLSTLHTNDAAGAIPRLENMGIEPFLIASSLNMVVGQRLVRKICQKCKQEITMPSGVQEKIFKDINTIRERNPGEAVRIQEPMTFWQGKGCEECGGKGYQGRIGIYEVLIMSDKLEQLALDRAPGSQIQEVAEEEGMLTMYQDGLLKVGAGLTTLDEVLRETSTK